MGLEGTLAGLTSRQILILLSAGCLQGLKPRQVFEQGDRHTRVAIVMAVVLNTGATTWESFELQAASTLYWQAVPVRLQLGDREDATCQLTVRILSGVNRHNHNLRVGRFSSFLKPLSLNRPSSWVVLASAQGNFSFVADTPRALIL